MYLRVLVKFSTGFLLLSVNEVTGYPNANKYRPDNSPCSFFHHRQIVGTGHQPRQICAGRAGVSGQARSDIRNSSDLIRTGALNRNAFPGRIKIVSPLCVHKATRINACLPIFLRKFECFAENLPSKQRINHFFHGKKQSQIVGKAGSQNIQGAAHL